MPIRIVSLETIHEVSDFDCGNTELNVFLQVIARQHQRKLISRTNVLINDDAPTEVMGFYTLAVRRMVFTDAFSPDMAKRLPREVPGFSLTRLAVRQDMKGRCHGEYLLFHALNRAACVAGEIDGYAVFFDTKNETTVAFHRKYEFTPFLTTRSFCACPSPRCRDKPGKPHPGAVPGMLIKKATAPSTRLSH
ncbi:N-acetyltransferase [Janthinobacterium sp. HSC-3S05]|uniref:N-acetyltransferase n=1 Tax=Janthinobacterium lividum TaxID=29581 RepID=UPI001CD82C46|nr:N-acetyltransferase [Janthinobacterium lividum]MCA1860133.1 N-acetyltransferase [Janthinobacterium lividum]